MVSVHLKISIAVFRSLEDKFNGNAHVYQLPRVRAWHLKDVMNGLVVPTPSHHVYERGQ